MTKEKTDNGVKGRLIEFCRFIGTSQAQFGLRIGKSRNYLSTCTGNLEDTTVAGIHGAYPGLNLNWVKTGEGSMLHDGARNFGLQGGESANATNSATIEDLLAEIEKLKASLEEKERLISQQSDQIHKLVNYLDSL